MALMQGLGRAVTRAGSSRAALGGVAAVGLTAGLVNSTARPALDAANEMAFSDKDTDRYFLGERGLSPGTILDSTVGAGSAAAGTIAGGTLGAAGGGLLGLGIGSTLNETKLKKDINIPKNFAQDIPLIGGKEVPLVGGKNLLKAGIGGRGKIGMAAAGAIIGGGFGASTFVRSHVNRNRDFYQQSPYNRGSAMQASSTNAYGDMVLGMHNSRRG